MADTLEGRRALTVVVAFVLAVAGFVLALPLGFVAIFALRAVGLTPLSPVQSIVLTLLLLQGTAFPLVAAGYLFVRGRSFAYVRARAPSLSDFGWSVAGFLGVAALAAVLMVVVVSLDLPRAQRTDRELLLSNPEVLLALVPLSILLIGPGEELLFRGVIQTTLREAFSAPVAIVIASLTFAPAHIISLQGGPAGLLVSISVLFVPSLVFGAVYEYTDNLVVPALAHGLYDAALFGLIYLSTQAGAGGAAGAAGAAAAAVGLSSRVG
jgi:membrane protease YdiL (CAAX protease family)